MQLSSKGRYAVMAMADLASHSAGLENAAPLTIASVAERQHISQTFLEQIFMHLRRAGLLESVRGPGGGYRLARRAKNISIYEIMQAVEEPVQMTRCSLDEVGGCVAGQRCLTHGLWQDLGQHITQFLTGTTLEDVLAGPQEGLTFEATSSKEAHV